MSYLEDPSFELGSVGAAWRPVNEPGAVTAGELTSDLAQSGTQVMYVSTSVLRGSIAQDFYVDGYQVRSISAFAWVRSSPDNVSPPPVLIEAELHDSPADLSPARIEAERVQVHDRLLDSPPDVYCTLTLWDLNNNRSTSANFVATQQWTLITNVLDLPLPPTVEPGESAGDRKVRVEFYINTVNQTLLVDSANAF